MLARSEARYGWLTLALSVVGCAIYGPDLVESSGSTEGGSGGMSGGGVMATAGAGATISDAGDPSVSGSGGSAGGTAGSGPVAGTGGDLTRPYVTGGTRVPPIIANLSTEGFRDWGHWGLKTAGDYNHKSGVTSQLLDFKPLGSESPEFKLGGPITFSWTGGTPTASATTTNGVTWTGLDQGFEMVVPAVDEERRVNLYIGVIAGTAELKASLSDPLAQSQVEDHIMSPVGQWNLRLLSVQYGFAAEGSELDITVKVVMAENATAAVSLHGVTFEGP